MEENKKKLFNKWWLFDLLGIALILFSFLIFPHLRDSIFWLLDWISLHDNYKIYPENFSQDIGIDKKQKAQEIHNQFIRNAGWALWLVLSLSGLGYGLYLATRGRKIQEKQWKTQHDSHLHDRYEKAAHMLGSEIMAVRIAGCQALRSLAIDDGKMNVQCIRLLFSFIRNPYLDDEDKKKIPNEDEYESIDKYEDEKFNNVFPRLKYLRDDIQEAANSFSAIYEEYGDEGIDKERIVLPNYFLKNTKKNSVTLTKAILLLIRCKEIYLPYSNLQGVILKNTDIEKAKLFCTNLKEANLENADLKGAYLQLSWLEGANLKEAKLQNTILHITRLQNANLKNANFTDASFIGAILSGADISDAEMQEAKGLTQEQILSAIWGYNEKGKGGPPKLPKYLAHDPKMQDWLATPHYDFREEGD